MIVDFIAYCRKVPIKKLGLNTYADFSKHLFSTFQNIFPTSQRIDIIFDLYLDQSVKQGKQGVLVSVAHHFSRWMFFELKELWIIGAKKGSENQVIPVHTLNDNLDGNVVEILPALHALTGILLRYSHC